MNDEQKEKLKQVKEVFSELGAMHRLREEFRKIFETSDSEVRGLLNWADWLRDADSKFPNSCGTIIRWLGEITCMKKTIIFG